MSNTKERENPFTSGPVRLGDLIRENKLMWTYCVECGREKDLKPDTLALPPSTPVPGLGRRYMRCSKCGSKKIDTRPELYPGGTVRLRASGGSIV